MFARYGMPEYWIVDPVRLEIEGHVIENGAYRCAQIATRGDIVRSGRAPGSDLHVREVSSASPVNYS